MRRPRLSRRRKIVSISRVPVTRRATAGVLQVLDAERSYQQARLGYVRAVVQRYIDTVQLFLALGGTSPDSGAHQKP